MDTSIFLVLTYLVLYPSLGYDLGLRFQITNWLVLSQVQPTLLWMELKLNRSQTMTSKVRHIRIFWFVLSLICDMIVWVCYWCGKLPVPSHVELFSEPDWNIIEVSHPVCLAQVKRRNVLSHHNNRVISCNESHRKLVKKSMFCCPQSRSWNGMVHRQAMYRDRVLISGGRTMAHTRRHIRDLTWCCKAQTMFCL